MRKKNPLAQAYIDKLIDKSRLPIDEVHIYQGKFDDVYPTSPIADVNIFGIFEKFNYQVYEDMTIKANTTCLFVRNSGHENIFA